MVTSKNVILWEADNGKEYKSEVEALRAEIAYWKPLGEYWLIHLKCKEEESKNRDRCKDRGGHQ